MTRRIAKKIVRRSPARSSGTYKKSSIWEAVRVMWRISGARQIATRSTGCFGSIKIVVHYNINEVWVARVSPAEP